MTTWTPGVPVAEGIYHMQMEGTAPESGLVYVDGDGMAHAVFWIPMTGLAGLNPAKTSFNGPFLAPTGASP